MGPHCGERKVNRIRLGWERPQGSEKRLCQLSSLSASRTCRSRAQREGCTMVALMEYLSPFGSRLPAMMLAIQTIGGAFYFSLCACYSKFSLLIEVFCLYMSRKQTFYLLKFFEASMQWFLSKPFSLGSRN